MNVINTTTVHDNACLYEGIVSVRASPVELNDLRIALKTIKRWESTVCKATGNQAGELTEFDFDLDYVTNTVNVIMRTGSNG